MKFLLLCCGFYISVCFADPAPIPRHYQGVWQGVGKQDDGSDWTIRIILNANDFYIDYPSLRCGGVLKLKQINDEHSLVFQEILDYGLQYCHNDGKTVLIKTAPDSLRYQWYFDKGRKAAVGNLTRTVIFKAPVRFNFI